MVGLFAGVFSSSENESHNIRLQFRLHRLQLYHSIVSITVLKQSTWRYSVIIVSLFHFIFFHHCNNKRIELHTVNDTRDTIDRPGEGARMLHYFNYYPLPTIRDLSRPKKEPWFMVSTSTVPDGILKTDFCVTCDRASGLHVCLRYNLDQRWWVARK